MAQSDGAMWLMCVCTSVSVWGFDDTSSTAQAEAVFRDLLALCGFLCGARASPLILFSSVILIGPGWRCAQRFRSEPDLLKSGHMFGLSCVKENYSEVNASKISHTSHLLAHTYGISQVLSALQLKISLLRWVRSLRRLGSSVRARRDVSSVWLWPSFPAARRPTPTSSCGGHRGSRRRGTDWRPAREESRPSATSAASTAIRSPEHHGKKERSRRKRGRWWRWSKSAVARRR